MNGAAYAPRMTEAKPMKAELNVDENRACHARYKYGEEVSMLQKVHAGEAKNALLDYDKEEEAERATKYLRVHARKKKTNVKIRKRGKLVFIFREE